MGRAWLVLGVALVLAGCGDDGMPAPDSGGVDGGGDDGGGVDGGGVDGGGVDGGGMDGGGDDGGGVDSGVDDAGRDAGMGMPCMAVGECDPFDPGSCGDGMACRAGGSDGGTGCGTVSDPPVTEGGACMSNMDCEPGTRCLDFGDGFICHRMCPDGSIGFCGDGMACFGTAGDECIRLCRPIPEDCDILMQDCVDPDDTCTLARHPETDEPYTGCRPAGMQGPGDPCGGMDGTCDHGLICIREADTTTCRHVCGGMDMPPTCTISGETCSGFARTWMVSYCRPAAG